VQAALVLVRLDHAASFIVNANHSWLRFWNLNRRSRAEDAWELAETHCASPRTVASLRERDIFPELPRRCTSLRWVEPAISTQHHIGAGQAWSDKDCPQRSSGFERRKSRRVSVCLARKRKRKRGRKRERIYATPPGQRAVSV